LIDIISTLYNRIIKKILDTYHSWRGENNKKYQDIPGFYKSATLEEVRKDDHILTPEGYVGY